ncbi:InlB B-repeat-containing protein [Oscillospiraceae bacterium NSJ-50]|uniref:InlB B-repeat-containing protein n=1 Tax=Qingrenia yutianensis TaxID=2763676 RepID=A0A926F792_9FIRM|nr:InlB B-repeat-containing protein [Qingrenia yutianensis]
MTLVMVLGMISSAAFAAGGDYSTRMVVEKVSNSNIDIKWMAQTKNGAVMKTVSAIIFKYDNTKYDMLTNDGEVITTKTMSDNLFGEYTDASYAQRVAVIDSPGLWNNSGIYTEAKGNWTFVLINLLSGSSMAKKEYTTETALAVVHLKLKSGSVDSGISQDSIALATAAEADGCAQSGIVVFIGADNKPLIYGKTDGTPDTLSITPSIDAGTGITFIAPPKPSPTITTAPTATVTYGDTVSDSALTGGVASVAGTFKWADGVTTYGNAGTKTLKAKFVPTDTANYATVEDIDVNVKVNKASAPAAPTGLKGIKGQTLSTVSLPGGWTWADGTTVMNTAGTQTFKANYTDTTGNYENATNVDVSVNVTAKSTAALTGLTQSGCTYGETLSAPSYTKPAGTIDSTIKVTYMGKGGTTYAESAAKPVKSGTYTVKLTLETADTIYSGTADFTIAQKDVTIRGFKVPNSAYNGDTKTSFNAAAAEIVGKITGDDVTVDTTAAEANFAQKDVGNDISVNFTGVKLAGADKDNYRINSVEPAKANIYQRTLTVKPDSGLSKKYGEADPALSSTVSGTIYGEMYIIDGKLEREAGENVGNYKILLGTLALKDNGAFKASNYILSLDTTAVYFEIKKAPAPSAPTGLSGMKGKTLATVPLTGGWAWADGTTVMNTAGTQSFKANYTDTTGNYENATNVDVTVEVIDKTNVSASITFADGELTYNGAGQAYETASISGITAGANPGWTYVYAPSGTGSLDASGKPQNAGTYTVTATYEDDDNYGTKSAVLKIKKAVPTGTPKYTEITSSDKTLADAAITTTGADFTALGTVIWVADDGVTPLPDTTVVAANTYYKWLFTPTDTNNYETLTGTIRLYYKSSGGGGGRSTSRYTVSFESNGGSKVSNQTVTRNSVMKEPTAPTKENFDFDGWYSDKKLKTKYDFSAKVTKSFTLYAKWTEKDNSVNQIILTIGKKDTQVFGKAKSNDVAPKIVNNRTMLPARFVAENLGADVSWDGDKELVTIKGKNLKTGEDVTILITIGAATAKVNGKEIKLDSAAFVENDRTYTPIRFISEELGASVEWVEKDKKVIITKPEIKKAETK